MTRKEWMTARCGHEVLVTIVVGSDGSEDFTEPLACDECEMAAETEAEIFNAHYVEPVEDLSPEELEAQAEADAEAWQAAGEAAAHLHGAWG